MMSSIKRRHFCQALAASTVIATSRQSVHASNRPHEMQFGLVTYLWGKDFALGELIDVCEESGVLGVELRTEHKHGVEPKLTSAQRQEVADRFERSAVELVGYGSNAQFHEKDPDRVKANVELTKKYIELMHDCGGTGVKVKPNGFPKDVPREKTIQQIARCLNEVAEYGEGFGQEIRVEVHGAGTSELPVMKAIFDLADHPNVGVCWNSNDVDLKGAGFDANFDMVKDRFARTVHIRELNVGEYPYKKLMRRFVDMNYAGWILLEARTNPKDKIAALIEQRELFESMTG